MILAVFISEIHRKMNITIARNIYETLVNQFLVITAETDILDYIEDSHRNKLNGLLNELNSLDYKILQIGDSKVTLTHKLTLLLLIKFFQF